MWNGWGVEEDNGEDMDDCEGDDRLQGGWGICFRDWGGVYCEQCKEQGEIGKEGSVLRVWRRSEVAAAVKASTWRLATSMLWRVAR